MGTRDAVWAAGSVVLGLALFACSPPGLPGEDEIGDGSSDGLDGSTGFDGSGDSGSDSGSDSSEADDGNDWGGGCAPGPGGESFLDICPPPDPCELVDCPAACVAGVCVEPAPRSACTPGFYLGEAGTLEVGPVLDLVFAELGDSAGQELAVLTEGSILVFDGADLVGTPVTGNHDRVVFGRWDGDAVDDLSLWGASDPLYRLGDGMLGFGPSAPVDPLPDSPSFGHPIAADLDGDGFDELAAAANGMPFAWRNEAGSFVPLAMPELLTGVLAALEIDGVAGAELVSLEGSLSGAWIDATGPMPVLVDYLPEGDTPAHLERGYTITGVAAGDLDGDGVDELVVGYGDAYREALRVWRGLDQAGLATPVDQELPAGHGFLALHDLDNDGAAEILMRSDAVQSFARADLDAGQILSCVAEIGPVGGQAAYGDLNGDGIVDVASDYGGSVEFSSIIPE